VTTRRNANPRTEEEQVHRHLHFVRRPEPQKEAVRPAKVIQLEARRKARLEAVDRARQQPRPAA